MLTCSKSIVKQSKDEKGIGLGHLTDTCGKSKTVVQARDHNNIQTGDHNTIHDESINIIIIQGFDDFTPQTISEEKFKGLMCNGAAKTILSCLKDQQFNSEKPENMNVYVSNFKDRIARVYNGAGSQTLTLD